MASVGGRAGREEGDDESGVLEDGENDASGGGVVGSAVGGGWEDLDEWGGGSGYVGVSLVTVAGLLT